MFHLKLSCKAFSLTKRCGKQQVKRDLRITDEQEMQTRCTYVIAVTKESEVAGHLSGF